ncbi:MAG TPA: MFS transporter [Sphingobacteriaceae bacterium]
MKLKWNDDRTFDAACLALFVSAMTFAIRANILGVLGNEFNLTPGEIGHIASAAFWGFTFAMFFGSPISNMIGSGLMFFIVFICHFFGIIFTILSVGYWSLFLSTFLVGFGNGFVHAASYPMIISRYEKSKSKRINDWYQWFPAGIVIGGILAYLLTLCGFGWKIQMLAMLPPVIIYGGKFIGQQFPSQNRITMAATYPKMVRECFRPLFIFMLFCMLLIAPIEIGTSQWIPELLSSSGIPSILLLVFVNIIMALGRYHAGIILKIITPTGLLFMSAIISFAGIVWLSNSSGYITFAAAGVFALGTCFFWPTLIGLVSETLPKTGTLGLSIMGGAGLLSTSLIIPYLGIVYESNLSRSISAGHDVNELNNVIIGSPGVSEWTQAKLIAGADTLKHISILPAVLVILFGILHFLRRHNSRIDAQNNSN